MRASQQRGTGTITRRSYLGMLGVAAIGTTAATAASNEEYEIVTVPADHREVVYVNDGETLENVLFDVTATGAGVSIVAIGTNWTIQNIAVRGQVEMGDNCVLCVGETGGGTSSIEDVWVGDGSEYEEKGATGLWVSPEHTGHLEIARVNIQNMSDNAFYCSAPGDEGGGTVALRDCYAANSWVSLYRLSEGTIENCVGAITDSREYRQGRGVWAWSPGAVEVRDCHLAMNGNHYSFVAGAVDKSSTITVSNTQWDDEFRGGWSEQDGGTIQFEDNNGTNPQNSIPNECPESIIDVLPGEAGDISIKDQDSPGETVVVARAAYKPERFGVVIKNESGDIIGQSDPIEGGETITDLTVDLDVSLEENQTVTAVLYNTDNGNLGDPIEINGDVVDDTAVITGNEGSDPIDQYRNEEGNIDTDGLRDAVSDWRSGDISTSLLRDVVGHWRTDGTSGE